MPFHAGYEGNALKHYYQYFDIYAQGKLGPHEVIDSLKFENDQLNSAINASSPIATQFSAIGKVIVRSPVSWYDSLTVKLGKNNNVAKNMLALSNGGLIGVVTDVSSTTSSIALLANGSDFSIPVKNFNLHQVMFLEF